MRATRQDDDVMAASNQVLGQRSAQETRAASDNDTHRQIVTIRSAYWLFVIRFGYWLLVKGDHGALRNNQ
jgi:hypothetical protein